MTTEARSFWSLYKPKFIGLVGANVIMWAFTNTVYKLPVSFSVVFSAFTLTFLIFFAIQDSGMVSRAKEGAKLVKFLIFYVGISGGIISGVIWVVTAKIGYPRMFIVTIIAFALLCLLLLYVLEFKKPMKEPKGLKSVNNLLILYLGTSFMYWFTTWALPNYDPKFEIEKLLAAALSTAGMSEKELAKAGKGVFKDFECFNCHNVESGKDPKRGPVLNEIDMGDYEKIYESMVDPYAEILKPYADQPKVARSMPDYYGKQMSKDELKALITYQLSLKTAVAIATDKMPDGWWTDEKVLAEGKRIYDGLYNEDVACQVCHGKDGTPQMEEASDFRSDEKYMKTTAARLFQVVKYGFGPDGSGLMTEWREYLDDEQIWQTIAYVNVVANNGEVKERPDPEGPDVIKPLEGNYWEEEE